MRIGVNLSLVQMAVRQMLGGAFTPATLFANSEPGVWYDPSDLTTLFQDSAGTTPVTAVEQPVGLMLDKSKGLTLGPELVTNGDFSGGTTGWTGVGNTISVVAGKIYITNTSNTPTFGSQSFTTVVGKRYFFSIAYESIVGQVAISFGTSQPAIDLFSAVRSGSGTLTGSFVATTTTSWVLLQTWTNTAGNAAYFDNISVRELPGNHAYQTTSTSRPVLSARYNLLTKTEQFDDAVWNKYFVSIGETVLAPNNTNTAVKIYPSSSGASRNIYRAYTHSGSERISIFAKRGEKYWIGIGTNAIPSQSCFFNLDTGQKGTIPSGYTANITGLENGWFLCEVYFTAGTVSNYYEIMVADNDGSTAVTANGTDGLYIWGASLVPSNQALLPYQRINTATDYDTTGFPKYLRFDGNDDWMVTPTITPGIDKAQVFAGVRKLSDAGSIIIETGLTYTSYGAFNLGYEPTNTQYVFAPRGARTGQVNDQANVTGFSSPDTAVLTAKVDLNAGTPAQLRRNGGAFANSINTTFGGGNFLAYPLYIGRRGGTTLPFNGYIYSLIIRFGANLDTTTIEQTENWVNGKTLAY